jgi:hypothetical protein
VTARVARFRSPRWRCDVLDVDDRVVDEKPECEDEGEERDAVDGVAGQVVDRRASDRRRPGPPRRRRATSRQPRHEREQRDHDERSPPRGLRAVQSTLLVGRLSAVSGDDEIDAFRQNFRLETLRLANHRRRDVDGIRSLLLRDRDGHRGDAAISLRIESIRPRRAADARSGAAGVGAEAFARSPAVADVADSLCGAVVDAGDLAEEDWPALGDADDERAELLGVANDPARTNVDGRVVAFDRAGGDLQIRGLYGPLHIENAQPASGERLAVDDDRQRARQAA